MPLPDSVRVGPWTYAVVTDPAQIADAAEGNVPESGTWGAFSDHERLIIGVNADHAADVLRMSVLHEVLHCCLRISGAWPGQYARLLAEAQHEDHGVDIEEYVVAGASGTLLGVLRDNPALTAWLTE
jgi:hypothetical protein